MTEVDPPVQTSATAMQPEASDVSFYPRFTRTASVALAGFVGIVALIVLVGGWGFNVDLLTRIRPGYSAMLPGTAVGFVLISTALLLHHFKPGRLANVALIVAASTVALMSAVKVANQIIARVSSSEVPGGVSEGDYMAVATSLCFMLACVCLVGLARVKLSDSQPADKMSPTWTTWCATAGLVVSSLAGIGYAFDVEALYAVWAFSAMAVHTALAFIALFVAILLSQPNEGWARLLLEPGPGSATARRLLPMVVIGPFVLCLIFLSLTRAGILEADFRLALKAIVMMLLGAIGVLWNAAIQNRAQRKIDRTMADLRTALDDRNLLLREVHHRVKNNLQQISALISFEKLKASDPDARTAFDSTSARLHALAAVHEMLIASRNPSKLNSKAFLVQLCEQISLAQGVTRRGIEFEVTADDLQLDVDSAIHLGLLANELIANALKHGVDELQDPRITFSFDVRSDGSAVLLLEDSGRKSAPQGSSEPSQSVGSKIILTLVRQLKGKMTVEADSGTRVRVEMPIRSLTG